MVRNIWVEAEEVPVLGLIAPANKENQKGYFSRNGDPKTSSTASYSPFSPWGEMELFIPDLPCQYLHLNRIEPELALTKDRPDNKKANLIGWPF